jgi:hypothetical protein
MLLWDDWNEISGGLVGPGVIQIATLTMDEFRCLCTSEHWDTHGIQEGDIRCLDCYVNGIQLNALPLIVDMICQDIGGMSRARKGCSVVQHCRKQYGHRNGQCN